MLWSRACIYLATWRLQFGERIFFVIVCEYTDVYPLSSAEAYMKLLVREKWARMEWWEELNKRSLCELMQSLLRRI
jgi:hypothetical protein